MGVVTRKATGEEILQLENCPCCGGSIEVVDCGYSSFNPGYAQCEGECGRRWDFESVDDRWDLGVKWNERAKKIRRDLHAFSLLQLKSSLSITRNFDEEALRDEARAILKRAENMVIEATDTGGE